VLFVSCFFFFIILYILPFCFLSGFLFYVTEIKVNELQKKQEIRRNTIVDKIIAKEKKAKDKK